MLPVHCLTRSISCRSAAYSPYNNVNLSFINFHERLRTSYRILFRHYRLASSAQQYLFHYQRGHLEPYFLYFPFYFLLFNLATLLFSISFSNYSSWNSSFLSSSPFSYPHFYHIRFLFTSRLSLFLSRFISHYSTIPPLILSFCHFTNTFFPLSLTISFSPDILVKN